MTTKLSKFLAIVTIGMSGTTGGAVADAMKFDFKDPKGVNNAVFKLDAPLEAISGNANGISGTVSYDPAKPDSIRGRIVVDATTLHVPNPTMKQHMQGEQWMDIAKYPEVSFEVTSVKSAYAAGDSASLEVVGAFVMHGVTNQVVAPVKLNYLPGKLADRTNGQMKGDLLVLRSTFKVKRSDYGINPKAPADKVADEVEVSLSVAGSAPKQ